MDYQIENEIIRIGISATGAEMQSIVKDGIEYLWSGDERYWPEHAPLLFPFVGRLTDGKYLLRGKEYEMDIHGFARKLPYQVVCRKEDKITLELCDSEETYASYPYHFRLSVTYELQGNTIHIRYQVENRSDNRMYFGIGGHPGFRVPLEEGLDFKDYYLEFGGRCYPDRVVHTEQCYVDGSNLRFPLEYNQRLKMAHHMFDEDAIVLQNMADEVTLKTDRGKRKVTVSYPQFPYLGMWHAPKTEASYICIEPWASLPSRQGVVEEFACKSDLIRLAPGEKYKNDWSITIE